MTMALFDAITAPGARVYNMAHRSAGPLTAFERQRFMDSRRVWVDESLHQRVDFDARTVDFSKDFGDLRLPFPLMWIEWVNNRNGTDLIHMAIQCFEVPPQQSGEFSYLAVPWMFMPHANAHGWGGYPTEYDQVFRIDFDAESGAPIGVSGYQRTFDEVEPIPQTMAAARGSKWETSLASLIDLCWNGLVAIGFMNCRNVRTERHDRQPKPSKKQRRPKPPKLDYHTIVLPSPRSGGGSGTGESAGVMAQHQVRGHFKTYTADAPLMGKHVGTYWWGWQVRGNKRNGIVISDYKIGKTA